MPNPLLRKPQRSYKNHPDYNELNFFVQRVLSEQRPRALILFGSAARGDYTDESDLDILIVFEKLTDNTWQEVYKYSQGTVIPLVWQQDQLLRALGQNNDFLRTIIKEGVFLAGDAMFWQRLKNNCAAIDL